MTTKRVTFYADETSLAYLQKTHKETGASTSEIIRRALRKMDEPPAIETRQHAPRASQPVLLPIRNVVED